MYQLLDVIFQRLCELQGLAKGWAVGACTNLCYSCYLRFNAYITVYTLQAIFLLDVLVSFASNYTSGLSTNTVRIPYSALFRPVMAVSACGRAIRACGVLPDSPYACVYVLS
jgi:hypothetical protein